jgi:hypothetical protein
MGCRDGLDILETRDFVFIDGCQEIITKVQSRLTLKFSLPVFDFQTNLHASARVFVCSTCHIAGSRNLLLVALKENAKNICMSTVLLFFILHTLPI